MSTNAYVNLDARFAFDLAQQFQRGEWQAQAPVDGRDAELLRNNVAARLFALAARVEGMDAKLARHIDGTFAQGEVAGEARTKTRSNVLRVGRKITNDEGEIIIAALADPEKVRRLPTGARTPPKAKVVADVTGRASAPARKGYKLTDL